MKIILFLLILSISAFSQANFHEKIKTTDWVKTGVRWADGSAVYSPEYVDADIQFHFQANEMLRITFNGKTYEQAYTLQDSILTIGEARYRILELNGIHLKIKELTEKEDAEEIVYTFLKKQLFVTPFQPKIFKTKNGEWLYQVEAPYLYPFFLNRQKSAAQFIYDKFAFPEWRKGFFLVRFVITKTGEVTSVRVEESTNAKFDEKLIQAVYATKGMWQAAEWDGTAVSSEVFMDFNLNDSEANEESPAQKYAQAEEWKEEGDYFFEEKLYKYALTCYDEAIKLNHKNTDAYFMRAATHIFLKEPSKACEDYQQLVFLEQTKAKALFDKYCTTK